MSRYETKYKTKSLKEFIPEYISETKRSIVVPEYSANKLFDQKIADLMRQEFDDDPTRMLNRLNECLNDIVREEGYKITLLNCQEDRETYQAVLNAVAALNIGYIPTIYSYTTDDDNLRMNAFAWGYGNNINIFLSQYLFGAVFHGIKEVIKEKEFIIGHELGHNQNNSTAFRILKVKETNEISRLGEYTADRAGLLACKDVEAAARALLRISFYNNTTDDEIRKAVKDILDNTEKFIAIPEPDRDTHPHVYRRVAAIKAFASSKLYARLTGAQEDDSMLSDEALEFRLARIIKGGK